MTARLPAPWRRLAGDDAGGVLIRTSRRELTNTVLVHAGPDALLVDPGWDPDELDAIAADLRTVGLVVRAGFATHAHHDHVLWHPGFGGGPRYASDAAVELADHEQATNRAALGPAFAARPDLLTLVGRLQPLTADLVPWSGPAIDVTVHDGHSPGHAALQVPEFGVLIAGDMLSDVEIPLLYETGPTAYAAALDALEPLVATADVVVPGHGHPGPGAPRLAADRAYLAALAGGGGGDDPRITTDTLRWAHEQNLAAG